MRVSRSFAPWCWLFVGTLTACGSGGTSTGFSNPTFVAIDPGEFTLRIPCATATDAGADALQSYSATLLAVTTTRSGVAKYRALATSPVTSCRAGVRFAIQVDPATVYRTRYAADLMGFAVPPEELGSLPEGQAALQEQARWLGSCGRGRIDTDAPGDAGRLEYPLVSGSIDSDAGVLDAVYGPKYAVEGRTVTLGGCALDPQP
jgi:hypothetical protein